MAYLRQRARQRKAAETLMRESEKTERALQRAQEVRDMGLACARCGELALPIVSTGDRYRCESCGCQFAGGDALLVCWSHEGLPG